MSKVKWTNEDVSLMVRIYSIVIYRIVVPMILLFSIVALNFLHGIDVLLWVIAFLAAPLLLWFPLQAIQRNRTLKDWELLAPDHQLDIRVSEDGITTKTSESEVDL